MKVRWPDQQLTQIPADGQSIGGIGKTHTYIGSDSDSKPSADGCTNMELTWNPSCEVPFCGWEGSLFQSIKEITFGLLA